MQWGWAQGYGPHHRRDQPAPQTASPPCSMQYLALTCIYVWSQWGQPGWIVVAYLVKACFHWGWPEGLGASRVGGVGQPT